MEREKKRRSGYQIKFATLFNEPQLTFCYGERALPSQDKDKPTLFFVHGLGSDKVVVDDLPKLTVTMTAVASV